MAPKRDHADDGKEFEIHHCVASEHEGNIQGYGLGADCGQQQDTGENDDLAEIDSRHQSQQQIVH
jgi:hypothetical protein